MNHGVIWSRAAHALMTTVWRPRVRVRVPDVDEGEKGVEVAEEVNDAGLIEEGDEAEESPSNKGAVRARGEATLEVQGVQRLSARSSAL